VGTEEKRVLCREHLGEEFAISGMRRELGQQKIQQGKFQSEKKNGMSMEP
jgi:hypothetical protein